MTSIIVPAADLYRVHQDAEVSFERGGYPSSVHDIYVHGYIEAVIVERQRIADSHERKRGNAA